MAYTVVACGYIVNLDVVWKKLEITCIGEEKQVLDNFCETHQLGRIELCGNEHCHAVFFWPSGKVFKLYSDHCDRDSKVVSFQHEKLSLTEIEHKRIKDLFSAAFGVKEEPRIHAYTTTTPLILAVMNGDVDMVNLFINKGVNVNLTDFFGRTPLILSESVAITRALLEAGADADYQTEDGVTALDAAIDLERGEEMISVIINAMKNPPLSNYENNKT